MTLPNLPKDLSTPVYVLDEAALKKNLATAARIKKETGCKILLAIHDHWRRKCFGY